MIIGDRLRELRKEKTLAQGDIEKRMGKANEQDRKIILLMAQKMAVRWPTNENTTSNEIRRAS